MAKGDLTIVLDKKDYERVQATLSNMSEVDQKATVQTALKEGMNTIIKAAKSNLSQRNKVRTGNLRGSFGTRIYKKKAYSIGGHRRPKGAAAHLVNYGTKKRWTKKGAYRGSVSKGAPNKGSEYFSDAVQSQSQNAMQTVLDAVQRELEKMK